MIRLSQVKKTFFQGENEISVLKSVDLELQAGQTAAILGPSGSGKSTLLNIISGIEPQSEGDVFFKDFDFSKLTQKEKDQLRFEKFGFVFQQFNLLSHLNVFENVLFPLELKKIPQAEEKAKKFLDSVGLSHRLNHFPPTLSGGEKQRVAIARALAGGPELILADEPSGSLDEESGKNIMDLFFGLVEESKCALLMVTHNPELAEHCDLSFVMKDGQIVSKDNRGQ